MNCNEDDLKFAIRESLTGPAKEAPFSIGAQLSPVTGIGKYTFPSRCRRPNRARL
jgi:hypothetical protein